MLKKKNDDFSEIEIIDAGSPCFLEEDIYIPEGLVKNKSLIRVDMNIVQFPVFSKNTKRKKNEITTYYFNRNRDTYITVKPSPGDLIPGEAEERIFIALMKIMKEKGMEQEFIVSATEIRDAAKITANCYISDIKKALSRLSETSYIFKNTMYSNEMKTVLKEEINTAILEYKSLCLEEPKNKILKNKINDKRIKEVYVIRISDHFYKNIVKRGYLVYDSDILLNISGGIARTLYMLIEKIRFDSLYVKESVFAFIKKIPLKYEKKSLSITIKTLEKAFNELKNKNLIKGFNFLKPTTWLEADIEIYFDEKHNELKQERFTEDNNELKNIYNTLAISFTEKNIGEIAPITVVTNEMVLEILNTLPLKARALKTMSKTIRESLEKYGYVKVKAAAIYLHKQKKITSPRAYFLKVLENDWAEDIKEIKSLSCKIDFNHNTDKIEGNDTPQYDERLYDQFERFNEKQKAEIENGAYKEYIKQCGGMNTKIQQTAFKYSKKRYICEYMQKLNIASEIPLEHIETIEPPKGQLELDEIKEKIVTAIGFGDMIYSYSDDEKKKLFRDILREMMGIALKGALTEEEATRIIGKYIEI